MSGLILGHLSSRPTRLDGLKALFDPGVTDHVAVQRWVGALQRKPVQHVVRLNNAVHTSVFAPTGVGKGVSLVIPWLLTNPESAVVIDFKGELAEKTADARKRMGHKIVLLDPFKVVTQRPDIYNPMQFIDGQSESMIDDCRDLAEAIVVRPPGEKEPHWNNRAEANIGVILSSIAHFSDEGDKSLQTMRDVLADGKKRENIINLMQESPALGGILSRLAHTIGHHGKEELGSILSHVQEHTSFLDTPAVAAITKGASTFDPADLRRGRMTIYLTLPPVHMRSQAPLLRLWLSGLLRTCIRGGVQERNLVHFICDEANALGKMDQLSDMLTIGRGYGIRLQLYYQDCGQLKSCWPDGADQTLLANTTQVFFGVNDPMTTDYLTKIMGDGTIIASSGGTSSGSSTSYNDGKRTTGTSDNANSNWSQVGRALLRPDEIRRLSPRIAITLAPGLPPIWTTLIRYYERGFPPKSGLSFSKCAFDTVALFLCAAIMAFVTVSVYCKENPGAAREVRQIYEQVKGAIGLGPDLRWLNDDPDYFDEMKGAIHVQGNARALRAGQRAVHRASPGGDRRHPGRRSRTVVGED